MRQLTSVSAARRAVATLLCAGVLLALQGPAWVAGSGDDRALTVMTRNLYIGADLAPALTATSQAEFIQAVASIYQNVQATDFPTRAAAIAREIDRADADIVGLQEVTRWTVTGPGAPPSLDFLAILLRELRERGISFSVASAVDNASFGPIPLLLCTGAFGECLLSVDDRDVVLVNDRIRDLTILRADSGRYVAHVALDSPVGPISFHRGWAAIDAKLDDERFRFVTTHLETEDFPSVQEAQGREFLAGPARSRHAVIAAGDFNSAADGSTTTTYAELTAHWFDDAWRPRKDGVGLTCCQSATLTNHSSELSSRIDLVLVHGLARPFDVDRVGDRPFQETAPLWASDHAGVVATVRIR
jgi:endonuclease/exonuclease/phosphatase family metal-dependent hydrolase